MLAEGVEPFRLLPLRRETMNYGWAAPMGLQLASGYDPYNYEHYRSYFFLMTTGERVTDGSVVWADAPRVARPDLADALNVEFLLSPTPLRSSNLEQVAHLPREPGFVFYRGFREADLYLYRNLRALPRAFFVEETVAAGSEEEELDLLERLDLRVAAVVDGEAGASAASEGDGARVAAYRPGGLELEVSTSNRRFLVISEVWHPGWQATLEGEPLALQRTNLALMGAWVPPGRHRIELEFTPLAWSLGRAISGLSLLLLLGLTGFAFVSARRG